VWDLTREPPTLGGALVLRMEGELLHDAAGPDPIPVHLLGSAPSAPLSRLITHVFGSASRRFEPRTGIPAPEDAWPDPATRARADFSSFSFARLLALHSTLGLAPRLAWAPALAAAAAETRARFPGRLVAVHLRRVPPFAEEESNADPAAWRSFLTAHTASGRTRFLLLGDDPVPAAVPLGAGIMHARTLGLPLALQLALIAEADGFLGMASGLCAAANFSATPHVIFKHPAHHAAAMRAELGDADRFPFAGPRQRLWRRPADRPALDAALDLILP
jgi:hypothetical protein